MTVTYFITGANRGVGFGLAKQLSKDPNNIVIGTSRSLKNAGDLQKLQRANLHIIELDITDDLANIKHALVKINDISASGVDVVIQNAAIGDEETSSPIIDASIDHFDKHLDVNVLGSIKVYKAIYPYWIKKNPDVASKKFIFVTSPVGLTNNFYSAPFAGYGVSKAALNHLSRSVALDHTNSDNGVLKSSITIALAPGMIRTQMSLPFRKDPNFDKLFVEPEVAGDNLIKIITELKKEDSGKYINQDGESISF